MSLTIGSEVLRAEIVRTGAALAALDVDRDLDDSLEASVPVVSPGPPHLGVMVGRYANRIGGARFTLDGVEHRLDASEGDNTLHSGRERWSTREWDVVEHTSNHVTMRLLSPDGDQGFPGEVEVLTTYRADGATLLMEAEATTTAPTVIAVTNHAYWDLSGQGEIRTHELDVAGDTVLAVDDGLVPTGEVVAFPSPVALDRGSIDRCVVLRPGAPVAARLAHRRTGLVMELATDAPGLQVYVADRGICLEAQAFPDSPNHEQFPSTVLRPGATYRWWAAHTFSRI